MTVERRTAIIYCDHLLYASETFIRAQASALKRHLPVYAGLRRVRGLELTKQRICILNDGSLVGRAKEVAFKLFGMAPGFVKDLQLLKSHLIHAHFGADGLRALPIANKLGVPLIVSFHGSDATVTNVDSHKVPYGHRRYLANKSQLQKGASHIIAVSEFVKSKLLAQGYPEEKVKVHYIGIDTQLFSPGSEESEPVVLFVGRLAERKGVDYLIRAMALVQNEIPELELVIIGDGPLRPQLEAMAKASLRRFRFLGVQTPEQVRDWMSRMRIFAAPSVRIGSGEEEGLGMVFLEAQAMEKPVVSFASGGIVEAVEHEVTGFLEQERDWQSLAKDISLLARDANLRRRMGTAGHERVLRLFNIERQTAILEDLYLDVTSRHASRTCHQGGA
jgi:colanic acid/amylovoran biosynthesis glycosyltransferase